MEKQNKFDVDYLPQGKRYITPDENFRFVKNNVFYKISCKLVRTITFLIGPLICKLFVGLKVRGKENLKELHGGAICVCNHVAVLDTLYVKQAVGHYRSYHTGAPWNNKKGLGGALLRRAGFLSLGGNIAAMRNFKNTVGELLQKGAIINYYPEHALWQNYEKPRPLKSGAFKTAANFGAPVLPLFVTFEGKKKRPVINVLPLILPDLSLPQRVAAQKMQDECAAVWKDLYEKTYGKQLCYDCAR
ncbi:MAG: lysophospholipid acyltransferase family protein [Candidatus Fimimonas sp.]